jgi:hypothetical protein
VQLSELVKPGTMVGTNWSVASEGGFIPNSTPLSNWSGFSASVDGTVTTGCFDVSSWRDWNTNAEPIGSRFFPSWFAQFSPDIPNNVPTGSVVLNLSSIGPSTDNGSGLLTFSAPHGVFTARMTDIDDPNPMPDVFLTVTF